MDDGILKLTGESKVIKVKDARPIIIRDREAGNEITRCWGIEEAREIIKQFEKEDKELDIYTENFYEIYNDRTKEIVK